MFSTFNDVVKGVAVRHVVHVVPLPPGVRPLMGADDQSQLILLQEGLQGGAMRSWQLQAALQKWKQALHELQVTAKRRPAGARPCTATAAQQLCSAGSTLSVVPVHREALHACGVSLVASSMSHDSPW